MSQNKKMQSGPALGWISCCSHLAGCELQASMWTLFQVPDQPQGSPWGRKERAPMCPGLLRAAPVKSDPGVQPGPAGGSLVPGTWGPGVPCFPAGGAESWGDRPHEDSSAGARTGLQRIR